MNNFQIKFEGAITRIEADIFRYNLVVEYRSPNDNKSYGKIDLNEGFSHTHIKPAFDPSGYHFAALGNGFMIFSRLADPTRQEEQEIVVYDIDSEKAICIIKGRRFSGFQSAESIEVMHLGFESIKNEIVPLDANRTQPESGIETANFQFPNLLHRTETKYTELKAMLTGYLDADVVFDIEILECNENLILGVHTKQGDILEKNLLILDEPSGLKKKIILYAKLSKRTTDTFFVYGNFLIFVSEYDRLHFLDTNSL